MRFIFQSYVVLLFSGCFALMALTGCSSSRKTTTQYQTMTVKPTSLAPPATSGLTSSEIIIKYAAYLKTDADSLKNVALYIFIDKWMKTPYKYGGTDITGIDCSAFVQRLLNDVYAIKLPRSSAQQFFTKNVEPFHGAQYFSEGDLVFFSTVPGNPISHVGIYLRNRIFVNASTSSGVSLASLDDPYWKKRFVAAGRVKMPYRQQTIGDRR